MQRKKKILMKEVVVTRNGFGAGHSGFTIFALDVDNPTNAGGKEHDLGLFLCGG